MKSYRRLTALLAALLLTLTASACGRGGSAEEAVSAADVSAADVVSAADLFNEDASSGADFSVIEPGAALPAESFITEESTTIESEYITFEIDSGVFVPAGFTAHADRLYLALEEVSGLSFLNGKYGCRPVVHVERPDLKTYSEINKDSEMAQAYAYADTVVCTPGELFIGRSYTLAHELSHTLQFAQLEPYPGKALCEGFAEYNCFKALRLLEKECPETAFALSPSQWSLSNMHVSRLDRLYEHDMAYWFGSGLEEFMGNDSYGCGFRLMAYFDDVYGDYSTWSKSYFGSTQDNLSAEEECATVALAYGEDALDGFYPWLKKHAAAFEPDPNFIHDFTALDHVDIYPEFNSFAHYLTLTTDPNGTEPVQYSDLTIGLDEARYYFDEYKGYDTDGLILRTDAANVELYDADGTLIGTAPGGDIELRGVSAVKLAGEGTLRRFIIFGYEEKTDTP